MGSKAILITAAAVIAAGVCVFLLSSTEPDGYDATWDETTELDERRASLKGAANESAIEADASPDKTTHTIRGKVLDEDDQPVAGLRVTATYTAPGWDPNDSAAYHAHFGPSAQLRRRLAAVRTPITEKPPPTAEATTNESGEFEIPDLKSGSYTLEAVVEPPRLSSRVSTTVSARSGRTPITVRLMTGTPIHGRVIDASDRPVAAVLRASWSDRGTMGAWRTWRSADIATTPSDGTFSIPAAPNGDLTFRVTVGERLTLTGIPAEAPSDDPLVIRIPGGQGSIHGLVSDPKQQVVAGADILVDVTLEATQDTPGKTPKVEFVAKSESNGAYRLEGLPDGEVTRIRAIASGFLPLQEQPPLAAWSGLALAGDLHEVDLTLFRGGRVHGVVRADDTGTPLADAHVQLFTATGAQGMGANHAPMSAQSDAAGRFTFEGVPAGRLILIASHPTHYLAALHANNTGANQVISYPMAASARSPTKLTIVMPDDGATIERNLELTPGYTIEGVVLDPDGQPVDDATVHVKGGSGNPLHNWGVGFWNQLKATTRTGPDGTFTYTALPARTDWQLFAKKKGYAAKYTDPVDLTADGDTPNVTIQLITGATVKGHVRTTDGEPVSGANVNMWSNQSQLAGGDTHTQTDENGAWEITGLPPGSYQMWVYSSTNYTTQQQSRVENLTEGEIRTGVDVEVGEGVEVSGTVTNSDGKPVPNLQLGLQSNSGGMFQQATTDAKGHFRFASANEGSTSFVSVLVAGSWTKIGKDFEPPVSDLEITYDPPPTHVIAGRILGPDDQPVPLCAVTVAGKEGAAASNMGWSPGNSPNEVVNGAFRRSVSGTPPFTITVSAPRGREGEPLNLLGATKRIESVPTKPVVIKLEGGQEIIGLVETSDGDPVPGVTVMTQDGSIRSVTGGDGRFTLGGVKNALMVQFQVPKGYVVPSARTLSPDKDAVITLQPGFQIKGTAYDPEGTPLDQGWINASWQAAGGAPAGASNTSIQGDGRFTLDGIPDGVLVNVQVNAGSTAGGPQFAPTTVKDVRPGTDDLVVELHVSVAIEGRVLDASGKPFKGGWVFAQNAAGMQVGGYSQIQPDSTFRLQGLEPGEYKLGVHRMSGSQAPNLAQVTAPASGVELQLPDSKKISGRIDGEGPFKHFWIRAQADGAQAQGSMSADGTWTIEGVADTQQWTVVAGSQNDDRYAMSEPVAAGTEDVVLKLREGLRIAGRVEDASGAPAKQAWVMAGRDAWSSWAQTDEDGNFTIRGLPPGDYKIQVLGMSGPNQTVREGVAAGTEDLVLTR